MCAMQLDLSGRAGGRWRAVKADVEQHAGELLLLLLLLLLLPPPPPPPPLLLLLLLLRSI